MVYLRKNLKSNIWWHSWPNLRVSVQVQSDNDNDFKFLEPLEFDFLAEFAKWSERNNFFLAPKKFKGQFARFLCGKSLFDGYNHFSLRISTHEILALESPETRKSSKRPSATLCVKKVKVKFLAHNKSLAIQAGVLLHIWFLFYKRFLYWGCGIIYSLKSCEQWQRVSSFILKFGWSYGVG